MKYRVSNTRMVLLVGLAVTAMLTGCATIRRLETGHTEQLLAAAGFVKLRATTAERQKHLAALPPHRLGSHTEDGKIVYIYADPDTCKCLYVGTAKEYVEYQRLSDAADLAWAAQEAQTNWTGHGH